MIDVIIAMRDLYILDSRAKEQQTIKNTLHSKRNYSLTESQLAIIEIKMLQSCIVRRAVYK